MIKPFVAVAIAVVTLTGCANNNTLSGDVFTASQAKQVQTVSYGTLISVRPVTIQGGDDNNVVGAIGGAVLGGFLGNAVGGGTGRSSSRSRRCCRRYCRARRSGALNRTDGVQLEIRKDDGQTILVVQKQGPTQFSVGQRVMLANSGSTITVSPR